MHALLERVSEGDGTSINVYRQAGPFHSAKCYFIDAIRPGSNGHGDFAKGSVTLLGHLLDWLLELDAEGGGGGGGGENSGVFTLAHIDLDVQNVLVGPDGSIEAVIDWEGAGAFPQAISNESYPSWLTRDWDQATYTWSRSMEEKLHGEDWNEDSPKTLEYYRSIWADLMLWHKADFESNVGKRV